MSVVRERPGDETPITNIRLAIRNAIDSAVGEIHTMIPGIVVKYDKENQTADIQVAIKRLTVEGKKLIVPPLRNVPIVFPRSSAASITFPLETDDPVMVLFCERPLDRWRQSGGLVDPGDHRFFHQYTDAFAVPGGYPDNDPHSWDNSDDRDGITVQTPDAKIVIDGSGKVRLGKRGAVPAEPAVLGDTLLDYLKDLHKSLADIIDLITTGPIGVGNLGAPVPTDPTLIANLLLEKTKLDEHKTKYVDTAGTNVVSQRTFLDRGA
jgi:hypothetical protein